MNKKALVCLILFLWALPAFAKKARTLTCPRKYPKTIKVPFNNVMTLEFPEKPKDSLPGNKQFDFKFIANDLAIKSLVPKARANLFVYLGKRKCSFKLVTVYSNADDIVFIKYPKEKIVEAKYVR